ncbi:MAG TPA: nicotinate phosphoribosyltransferase [Egibacteraceae bacterium]|nr:nicotinate phosphoribosyltransferase [Egibacteraceae bacterium]
MTGHRRDGSARTGRAGLCTDLYELRMVESYLRRGMTGPATFSLFVRPAAARPWYVAFGVQRLVELLESFRYGDEELAYLRSQGIGEETLDWLGALEPTGQVWAVPDGTVVLAQEPIAEVSAPLPVAQLLETAALNLVQYSTAVATKAARCALAAEGRRLADFGFRRAHGIETGVEAALAAFVGGGFATSNVEAGRRHGIPVTGTMAHSYIQAFNDERDAFGAFAGDHPDHTVLLVDTYDTLEGVRRAIAVAEEELAPRGHRLQGIRLDSGDLGDLAQQSRKLLDDAGLHDTEIFASGSLDEYRIHELVGEQAPIDAFGVGSALTTSSDHPALDIVYKLVDYDGRSVAKFSGAKSTWPGRKQVFRPADGPDGDVLSLRDADEAGRRLLEPVWRDGAVLLPFDAAATRERVTTGLAALPAAWRLPPYPGEAPLPRIGAALVAEAGRVREAAFG